MTVYENVATSKIVNLFNSINREEFKTQEGDFSLRSVLPAHSSEIFQSVSCSAALE